MTTLSGNLEAGTDRVHALTEFANVILHNRALMRENVQDSWRLQTGTSNMKAERRGTMTEQWMLERLQHQLLLARIIILHCSTSTYLAASTQATLQR